MSMVFLGGALVAAAVTLFILQPILSGLHASLVRAEDELTDTEARKRVTLLALRDVEYDFLAGKLDEEDYLSLKADFTAEALAALEADAVQPLVQVDRVVAGHDVGAAGAAVRPM